MKIAIITGPFPQFAETFIINQIGDLIDQGIEVSIFAFGPGDASFIHRRYDQYRMREFTADLEPPKNLVQRLLNAFGVACRLVVRNPRVLCRALNLKRHGDLVRSFRTLFWVAPFVGKSFDIVHCNYGPIANRYLIIRDMLGEPYTSTPFITTFYGYDASMKLKEKGLHYYDRLKTEGAFFLTMSEDMKERLVREAGFDPAKIMPLPAGVDTEHIEWHERHAHPGESTRLVSVGRFTEKKGFDDLLRAVALLRKRTRTPFRVTIVGSGHLDAELKALAKKLRVTDIVSFPGRMQPEELFGLYRGADLYVQASKVAPNGDRE